MTSTLIREHAATQTKQRPEIRPGFTVRVHERIQEGNKERVQVFEGLVISMHNGHTLLDTSFTVRRIVSGVGVEKVFALHSPKIEKIEVKKVAKVRRAKLFFLRGRRGKAARLSERFTTADEFAIAAEVAEEAAPEEEVANQEAKNSPKAEAADSSEDTQPSSESSDSSDASDSSDSKKEEAKDEKKEEAKDDKKEDA